MVDVPSFTKGTLDALLSGTGQGGGLGRGWAGEYRRHQNDLGKWKPTMDRVLAEVGQKLLAPILKAVPPNIKHLIFLPSGGLFLLPLHAAPLSRRGTKRVRDRYQVTYAPSAGVLSSLPELGLPPKRHGLVATVNRPDLAHLKLAPIEGLAVGQVVTHPQYLRDGGATKEAFVREARDRAYVHFAGHGEYDWNDPPRSGLWLADGKLTLAELERGQLDGEGGAKVDLSAARLVTLSACETGIADVFEGSADEYLSLPAGFLRAGVPCVVSSLWQVEDLSTALLMERFYRNHIKEHMAPGLALHEAQGWMCGRLSLKQVMDKIDGYQETYRQKGHDDLIPLLEETRAALTARAGEEPGALPYAHPFYWAGFTVVGR
jgi:CHAT domain-containing protein